MCCGVVGLAGRWGIGAVAVGAVQPPIGLWSGDPPREPEGLVKVGPIVGPIGLVNAWNPAKTTIATFQEKRAFLLPIPIFIGGLGLAVGPQVGARGALAAVALPIPKLAKSASGSFILVSRFGVLAFLGIVGAVIGRLGTFGATKLSQLPKRSPSLF